MIALKTGRLWDLLIFASFLILILYYMDKASKGKPLPKIRTIAALEAIKEGIGRAVEIRKPVHFSFGAYGAYLTGDAVSETVAAVGVLGYTAGQVAKLGARLIFHLPQQPYAIPLLEGAVDEAYMKEGKAGEWNKAADMRFYGYGTMVHTSAMASSMTADGVAMNVMVGRQTTIVYPAMEAAKLQGAINIGGTTRWTAMYIFALTCDYLFIGEEIYAAGAKVTENPYMIASIAVEEIMKYAAMGVVALALVLGLAGFDIVSFFKM
ncbi:hypothetical protein JW865_06270 [Candidatus Bathyarchaeota archaeon]|nr:hypothetical protein [Candidatus Bathyarchaeota archaeon]